MMHKSDKIEITLIVAGHPLKMTINPDDRERIELAAADANMAWESWSQRYKGRQKSEILAMITLMIAEKALALKEENMRLESVIEEFENRLDNILMASPGLDG